MNDVSGTGDRRICHRVHEAGDDEGVGVVEIDINGNDGATHRNPCDARKDNCKLVTGL